MRYAASRGREPMGSHAVDRKFRDKDTGQGR